MKLQHKPIVRVKPEWALKVLKHYRSQWTEIEKIVHKMMFELLFHPFSDFHYHAPLQPTSSSRDALPVKEGLLVMAAGERGFWNAFCFQQTEEDKIQQSTFSMSRYFREGRANIFVPFYNGTKTSCYLLFSCWQTWNLPNSHFFIFTEERRGGRTFYWSMFNVVDPVNFVNLCFWKCFYLSSWRPSGLA